MAYATEDDVEAALGRSLGGLDVAFLLESASDQIEGYLNLYPVPEPVPGAITRVCAEMVAAAINRPQTPNVSDDTYNPGNTFAYAVGPMSVGPWLTAAQRERLDNYRAPVFSIELTSETIGSDVSASLNATTDVYGGTDISGWGGATP